MMLPRIHRPSWEDVFMNIAVSIAQRSPDPNTQVGAIVVDKSNRIISTGYNGTPRGIEPAILPWDRSAANPLDTKYPYVVHAELNAILNCVHRPEDCVVYVTLHPCNECAKAIIQSGITSVVYLDVHPSDSWQFQAAAKLLNSANISLVRYTRREELLQLSKDILNATTKTT